MGLISNVPFWIFYPSSESLTGLSQLKGKRIAVGPEGSGARYTAERLLGKADNNAKTATLLPFSGDAAVGALMDGSADVAFIVGGSDAPSVAKLLTNPKLRLLNFSTAEALTRMFPDLVRLVLPKGVIEIDPPNPPENVTLVGTTARGLIRDDLHPAIVLVSLLILTAAGDALETTMVGREGAVGLQGRFGTRFSFTRAITQIGGRFSVIGASRFGELVNGDPAVSNLFSGYAEVLLAEAQQIAACNAVHDGVSRLARCLLQSADRIGSDELMLTQETLAEMLGVRRTTVTLLAQALKDKGLIRYSRGHLVITNRKSLESAACECYQAVHHDRLPVTLGIKL